MGSSFLGETALPVSRPRRPVEFPGKRRLENQMGLLVETCALEPKNNKGFRGVKDFFSVFHP